MDSVFLGGMLASSSTTIISKAFDELGVKTKKYAGIADVITGKNISDLDEKKLVSE